MALIAPRTSIFNARPIAAITLENKAVRELVETFIAYSNAQIGGKDAVHRVEQQILNYKLE